MRPGEKGTAIMKLTTMTQLTVDGVTQENGGASDEDRRNGFERGGWAMGVADDETRTLITQTYQRADAFLFGRRTYELVPVVLGQGAPLFPDAGPDIALDLVSSRADSKGVTIQVYRPAGRPRYARPC
jgi:dihydrofolate reductase